MNLKRKFILLFGLKGHFFFYSLLSITILLIASATLYSTTKAISTRTSTAKPEHFTLVPMQQPTPAGSNANFVPFLHIVPDSRGETVTISLNSEQPLPGMLYANLGIGPTGDKSGWTFPYSDTKKSHISTVPFALSETPIAGSVNLTSSQGLNSVDVQFNGVEVPAQSRDSIWSEDRQVELEPASEETIPAKTYVVIVTNAGQPGPAPIGHQLIGTSYSMRAANNLVDTPQPMNLVWHTNTPAFANVDLQTLDIFFWGEGVGWIPLHAQLSRSVGWLYTQTNLFGTYAVFAQPQWQGRFDNLDSLEPTTITNLDITALDDQSVLGLIDTPDVGSATSRLIAPAYGLQHWGTVTFTATMSAPSTLLAVDVVDDAGNVIMPNVSSGQSLADLDINEHPSLRLRTHLTSTVAGETPGLQQWQVTWQPPQPVVLGVGSGSVELGQIITVPLTLAPPPAVTVGGLTLDVRYDPAVLRVVDCRLHLTADLPGLCNAAYDTDGINPDGVRLSLIASTTVTTANPIVDLSFQAIGWAPTPTQIEIANMLAVDPAGEGLPVVTASGQIAITTAATGDVNCDGSVNDTDVNLILGYIVNVQQASTTCPPPAGSLFLPQCDVNRDNVCDVRDAQMIAR